MSPESGLAQSRCGIRLRYRHVGREKPAITTKAARLHAEEIVISAPPRTCIRAIMAERPANPIRVLTKILVSCRPKRPGRASGLL